MKVIYDKKTGYIYTTAYIEGDIDPAVLDVNVPNNQLISRIILEEGKEPRAEFYKTAEQTKLEEMEKEFKEKLEELNTKQQTTDLALAELTMNSMSM